MNIVAESERGAKSQRSRMCAARRPGFVPYLTRAEIEQGRLAGQGLELMYFKDPVDVFFMQVQGSGRVELPDGTRCASPTTARTAIPKGRSAAC